MPAMACTTRLREIRTRGHEHWLGGGIHYYGARATRTRRGFPACLHILCGRGAHGNEYRTRLGGLTPQRFRGRTAALLVTDKSFSLRSAHAGKQAKDADGERAL